MRFAQALRFLFLLLLSVSVFGSEVVESYRLRDDVSNDFVQISATSIHKSVQIAPGYLVSEKSTAPAEEAVSSLALPPLAKSALLSASDLLRLISIQRK